MITIPEIDPKMIANNLKPAYPTHSGEILKEEIEYRATSQKKLTAEMALLIKAALGLDAEPLLKIILLFY